jgi:hypothetical protein
MKEDFWLPPEEVDPPKLKPIRLGAAEYDILHTALTELQRWARKSGPDKVREVIGAVELSTATAATEEINEPLPTRPSLLRIYRDYTDHWACRHCKAKGDKWYMVSHHCSGSKVKKMSWFRIKQGQRKAERIRKLEKEHIKLD